MGIRAALSLSRAVTAAGEHQVPPLRVQAPWAADSTLQALVWSDLIDAENLPVDRAAAMQIPAWSRSRHLLTGSIASCPLVLVINDVEQPTAPLWATRTDQLQTPYHRMLWTVDDLMHYGHSLWAMPRGTDNLPLTAARVDPALWRFGTDGTSVIDSRTHEPITSATHILISGPHEGVLAFGARTLRTAARLERTTARHAAQPVPAVDLHQTEDIELEPDEKAELVAMWVKARQSEYGSVAFTPFGIEARALGEVPEALLIDGRNSLAVDIARHASIPAALIDATSAGASLTYETTEGRNVQFLDYGASLYMDPISARLSQDDVVPRGQRMAFKTSQLTATSRGALDPLESDD